MGWAAIVAAVIETGLSIKEDMDTSDYRSRVLSDLNEIKNHLNIIESKIDILVESNRVILERLNILPTKIYQLTNEIVANHLLTERYVNIKAQQTLFNAINNHEEWELSKEGWLDFNKDLHYIFLKENRISHLLNLIPISELTIGIYGKLGEDIIKILLQEKLDRLNTLVDRLEDIIIENLDKLKSLLDNKKYISNHNMDSNLESIANLSYETIGHKKKTQYYTELVCPVSASECCRWRSRCYNRQRSRTVPDNAYNESHDLHISKINKQIEFLNPVLINFSDLKQVKTVINDYNQYLLTTTENSSERNETVLTSYGPDELLEKSTMKTTAFIRKNTECY